MESADLKTKRALGDIYFKRVLEPDDHQQLLDILDTNDVRAEAESAVCQYFQEAADALGGADLESEGLEPLLAFARHLVEAGRTDGQPWS